MNAITFHDLETLVFEEVDDPVLEAPSDALVRVRAAGICGSDLHPYFGRERGLDPGTVMGHEFLGEVVEVGSDVTRFGAGDRVVAPFSTSCGVCFYCRTGLTARCAEGQLFGWVQQGRGLQGAQAELVRVPLADGTLVGVPEGMDDAVALLAGDILSTAAFAADLAGVRFLTALFTALGAGALLLAVSGVYGLVSYTVSQRTREIGVRMSLGASKGVVRMGVLADGLRLAVVGVTVGAVVAYGLGRALTAAFFGLVDLEPLTFAGTALALFLAVALASWFPAVRATRVDPVDALR